MLSIPDQFSCEMSTIPCYRERLRAMVFKLHFQDKLEEIKPVSYNNWLHAVSCDVSCDESCDLCGNAIL